MTIKLAKSAGFCFGVNRAVNMAYSLLEAGEKLCTIGPIVHNNSIVAELEAKGCRVINKVEEAAAGEAVLVRAHGVPRCVYELLESKKIEYKDATCPNVKKIHNIVDEAGKRGDTVIIIGSEHHPEVIGIKGHCSGKAYVAGDIDKLEKIIEIINYSGDNFVTVVSQTTAESKFYEKCVKLIKKGCTNAKIFATICFATFLRQKEAEQLSAECDFMVVIGSEGSSNTEKLYNICNRQCETVLLENAAGLSDDLISKIAQADTIGITAGASTPAAIIKEVCNSMTEKINGDESFAALLEESFKNSNTNGKVVTGTVVSIAPGEIYVDVGRKQSGIVQLDELTDNPNLKTEDCVKVGDTLDLMILRTNDQEGYIYLSKKILDSSRAWDEVKAAAPKIVNRDRRRGRRDDEEEFVTAEESDAENAGKDTQDVIEQEIETPVIFTGVVTEVVNAGVVVSYKGVKVFIPASQATLNRNDPLEGLLKKEVKFVILEVNPGRRRAVGSISRVLREERRAKEGAFWETIEVDQEFTGTVKSVMSYGAFVDLGAVDGMVHISELSWNRIKHPSEVINVGDVVNVYVKKVDKEKKKISLGYKKQEDNPWEILRVKYPVGTVIEGQVVSTPAFGAFVRIIPGIDGLVHISQLSTSRVATPTEVVNVGDTVRAEIIDIDFERKRVSLSMRKLLLEQEAEAAENGLEDDAAPVPIEEYAAEAGEE